MSTSGTTKDISIDDLPDLPSYLHKKLYDNLCEIQRKAEKQKRWLDAKDVQDVRRNFFEFFCHMLKYFNTGVDRSDWMEQRRQNKLSCDCDSAKLFNYEEFLNKYSGGLQTNDSESWSFLRYFTSMPLFKRLVERCVLQ